MGHLMRRFTPVPVQPVGRCSAPTFVDYADGTGALCNVERPVYPPSAQGYAMRVLRHAGPRHVSIAEAAGLLGMAAVQVSGLERGLYTLPEPEWALLFERLHAAKLQPRG